MKAKILFPLIVLVTLLRVWWVLGHEVTPWEAYYWMCAHHLDGGYFDGPAGTAWLVWAFGESFRAARLFWPVLGFFCSGAAWIFARRTFDEDVAGWCVIFLNVLPVFNGAALEVGPLLPALISIFTGLVFARLAWEGRRWGWLGAGIFFGVALCFRYEAILIPLGLLVTASAGSRHRTAADMFGLAAILLFCVLALWPALRWNAGLDWIPIAGGTLSTAWEFRWDPLTTSSADFASAFSLPVMIVIPIAIWFLARDARRHGRAGFMLAACGGAWAWALYQLLHGGDAVTAGLLGVVPLAAFVIFSMRSDRRIVAVGSIAGVGALLTTVAALSFHSPGSWKTVAEQLRAAGRDLPAAEANGFFVAEDARLAAVLGFYLPAEGNYPPVFVPESPDISSQFGLWPSYADFVDSDQVTDEYFTEQKGVNPFVGRNAIYVGHELPQTIKGAFQEVQELRKIPSPDGRDLTIYICTAYQTLPL